MATQKYFKRNYIEPLKIITPEVYLQKDEELFGTQTSHVASLMNSHIRAADNISTLFPQLSSTPNFPTITSVSGIAPFFITQLGYGDFSTPKFQVNILSKLGINITDFDTSADFKDYVSGTFLPSIQLGSETLHTDTSSVFDSTLSGTHEYLLRNMDWMFILNASAPVGGSYAPSTYVTDTLVNETYFGKSINLEDGIKGFQEYIWKNWNVFSGIGAGALLPDNYYSSTGEWTSGTQSLDKLKTLVEVLYSTEFSDSTDTFALQAFKDYIDAGLLVEDIEAGGPFTKLLRAMSFSIADRNAEVNKLDAILDIEQCPEEYLPYLADLLGWELIGPNVSKWRKQLRNATTIYKAKGTRKALQTAVDAVYKNDVIQGYSTIQELWESYIPNLLYYLLLTDTGTLFTETTPDGGSFDTWTQQTALDTYGVSDYSHSDSDTNIRFCVDHMLYRSVEEFPEQFYFGGELYPFGASSFVFKYRGRRFGIPPWETENFYRECHVTQDLLTFLKNQLLSFGVSTSKAEAFYDYCVEKVLEVSDDALLGGSFVFFTSSNEYPPNYDDIINNLEAEKTHLIGLWNGKSSHIDLTLSAGDFSLSILSDSVADKDSFFQSLKVLDKFAPAHAILKTKLIASDSEYATVSSVNCPKIEKDFTASNSVSGEVSFPGETYNLDSNLGGGSDDGANMSGLGNVFKREDVGSYSSPALAISGMVGEAPIPFGNEGIGRNSRRRRNYAHALPRSGSQLYLRDGDSMPIILNPSDTGRDNYLGYIPSSGRYVSASAYNDLPAIYGLGENLNSPHTYYGVDVSNTYPCRGTSSLVASSCHPYSVRGETPLIWVTLNELMRSKNLQRAAKQLELNSDHYFLSSVWMDVSSSIANSYPAPQGIEDYENFEFGSDLHTLFSVWKSAYPSMSLRNFVGLVLEGGEYVSPLFNGDLELSGFAIPSLPYNAIASSMYDTLPLDKNNLFKTGAEASGTYYLTSGLETPYLSEFSNSGLLSGITYSVAEEGINIYQSRYTDISGLTIHHLTTKDPYADWVTDYSQNKTFLELIGGVSRYATPSPSSTMFSRLSFNLNDIANIDPTYLTSLAPDKAYKVNVRCSFLGVTTGGDVIEPYVDGVGFRIMVRTEYDTDTSSFWYCKTKEVNYVDTQLPGNGGAVDLAYVGGVLWPDASQMWKKYDIINGDNTHGHKLDSYIKWNASWFANLYSKEASLVPRSFYYRADEFNSHPDLGRLYVYTLDENNMFDVEFFFNTNQDADNVDGGVEIHNNNTNYVIEIIPCTFDFNPVNLFSMVIEQVSITDTISGEKTNLINNYTVPNFETGEDETYTENIDLTAEQILRIFQFWNNVSTSVLQSRVGGPGYTGPQGGSRLNYRMHPEWYNNTKGSGGQYTKINIK